MTREEAKKQIIQAWNQELHGKIGFTEYFHACANCEQANFRAKFEKDDETKEQHLQVACFCGLRHTDVTDWPTICQGNCKD